MFSGCNKLNKIKLNINIDNYKSKKNEDSNIFYGVPENGTFIYRKGEKNNKSFLRNLPLSWDKIEE